ncbi:MAG: anthranilate phosphoribosyltransferase [Desulfobacterales bacterium]|nr:anthranilate phosphoribosyltransferase [Desulfobacterales bacterium]
MIRKSIRKVVMGENLSESEMEKTMEQVIDGKATSSQVGSFVTALRMKGETVDEITGAAKALNSRVLKLRTDNHVLSLDRDDINVEEETIIETCDTEESGTNTFNVSTATIFVVAGGGIKVARHGNRASSKYFGTADVLESLGVKLDISRSDVERCIEEVGIGFLFAPLFQGLMKHVAGIRAEIGIRTLFNMIGPLANPAGAYAHVLGVYEPSLTEKMAQVLNRMGAEQAFVICGKGTFDEISICGPTRISHMKNGEVKAFVVEPEEYGFQRVNRECLQGGNVRSNAQIIRKILEGETGPRRDIVVFNSAAAFVAAGVESDLKDGIKRAEVVIDSGKAKEKLESLVQFTTQCAPFVRKEL